MTAEPKWWHGTPGTLKWAFARIRELEARIADYESAVCDYCGHRFYALETEGGGRESGGHAGSHPVPVARGSVSAAANPAARKEAGR